ncbi:MAG: tetratricopeptide repeat protein [Bacteroidales bacterium]|jgi:TolA-binding protein|nr:tetratricopeptide repeat protein [Bacteroidales bacterium]
MRKLKWICGLLIYAIYTGGFVQAQKTYISHYPERLFEEGRKMYADENYIACIERMQAYKKTAADGEFVRHADYYIAASSFAKNNPDAKETLQDFLNHYPASEYENRINFMMASLYFLDDDYRDAKKWFAKSDMFLLSENEQEDYSFRYAYCALQSGDEQEALPFFTALSLNSKKYREPAIFYKGYIFFQQHNFSKALSDFKSLQNSRDYKTASGFYITQIYFLNEQYEEATANALQLLKANDLRPDHRIETLRMAGESFYKIGDFSQAGHYLSRYINESSEPLSSSRFLLGSVFFKQYDFAKAIQQFNRMKTGNDLLSQNAFFLLGQSYLQLNDKPNARQAFASASNMSFDRDIQEIAMYNCGMLTHELSFSAFGESVSIFERFLNLFPNSRFADKINDCLIETYLTTRDYRSALTSIEKIRQPSRKILEAKQNVLFQLGTECVANNEFNASANYFTQSIRLGDYDTSVKALNFFWRGESYYRLGQYASAISDYAACLPQASRNDSEVYALALYNMAYAYFKQKNYTAALNNFQKYLSAENNTSSALYFDSYNRIGDCFFYNRNLTQAENAYSKAASLSGNSDYALFQKAVVMGLQKNYSGKITALNSLIDKYTHSKYQPDAYYEKARAYVMLGQNGNAISVFEQLEANFPQSSWSRKAGIQKGMLYLDNRQLADAAVAYKQVIANYPASEEAQIAIQDLKAVYTEMNDIQGYVNYVRSAGINIRFDIAEQDSLTYLAAEKLYMRGENARAKSALMRYLSDFPKGAFSLNAHYYLALAYLSEKNHLQAEKELEYIIQTPDNKFTEDALARYAEIAFAKHDYRKALACYQDLYRKAEFADNRLNAATGILRSAAQLHEAHTVIGVATDLLQDKKLSPELQHEALSERAKAYFQANNPEKAAADLQQLAGDTRNAYGAEAAYLLGQYYFDTSRLEKAEEIASNFIRKGTPHAYWLARGFILMADISAAKKDLLSAKQYLQSLKTNYKNPPDDIAGMIDDRLKRLK